MIPEPKLAHLRIGMTHAEARAAIAAVWPNVVLQLYNGSPSYYKEGPPYADDATTADDDVLRPQGPHATDGRAATDSVVITGRLTSRELRDLIYGVFGLEPQFEFARPQPPVGSLSLDEMEAAAARRG